MTLAWFVSIKKLFDLLEKLQIQHFFITLFSVTFILRLGWLLLIDNGLVSDFAVYHELAAALVTGKGYAITGPVGIEDLKLYLVDNGDLPYTTAYRAPGAPLWGAFLYLLFGIKPIAFFISNLILGLITPVIIYKFLENTSISKLKRKASFLWAIYPPAFMATNLFGTETLFCFFFLLTVYCITKSKKYKSAIGFVAIAGILTGLAALTRSMLMMIFLPGLVVLIYQHKTRRGMILFGIYFIFIFLTLSPWMVRNWNVYGKIIPICTSEGEFLGRHSTMLVADKVKYSPEWMARYAKWLQVKDESEKSSQGYRIAVANLKSFFTSHPFHIIKRLHSNVIETFATDVEVSIWSTIRSHATIREKGPSHAVSLTTHHFLTLFCMSFYIMAIISAFFVVWNKYMNKLVKNEVIIFLALHFLLTFTAFLLLNGQDRYHFIVMPFILLLSSHFYDENRFLKKIHV